MSVIPKLNDSHPIWFYLVLLGFMKMSGVFLHAEDLTQNPNIQIYEIAAKAANQNGNRSLPGKDPEWLFLRNELIHVGKGEFWQKDWSKITVSGKDPLEIFTSFKRKLDSLGVEFIFVPIPAKFTIYPDKFSKSVAISDGLPASNEFNQMKPYLDKFREQGITVIDLEPVLKMRRKKEGSVSFCRTDSHPSPWTCQKIAEILSERINSLDWAKKHRSESNLSFIKREPETIKIYGDLIPNENRKAWDPEELIVSKVYSNKNGNNIPVSPDDESSPVIVMGDSHTLIFHEGDDMHASGAGVVDHLQEKIGFKVFLAASRGSSSQALRQIYKGEDFWKSKKTLIWISSIREFTEERRWLQLPRLPR